MERISVSIDAEQKQIDSFDLQILAVEFFNLTQPVGHGFRGCP